MSDAATGPQAFMTEDHRACDVLWSELEAAIDAEDEARARELWGRFNGAIRRHLDMEELVLFPAFENVTGMHGGGPTAVMRMEHQQMRGVLDQMGGAASSGDLQGVLDHGDTLLMLTQQHNVKEEGILYPMLDRLLAAQWPELVSQLNQIASH